MISYTQFKRQFAVGMVLEVEHHERPEIGGRRVVTKVQTNAIVMQPLDRPSAGGWWMHWPAASSARVVDDETLQLLRPTGEPMVTYRIQR